VVATPLARDLFFARPLLELHIQPFAYNWRLQIDAALCIAIARLAITVSVACSGDDWKRRMEDNAPMSKARGLAETTMLRRVTPGFQRSVSVAVAVSVKTVSVQAVYAVAAGACARQ